MLRNFIFFGPLAPDVTEMVVLPFAKSQRSFPNIKNVAFRTSNYIHNTGAGARKRPLDIEAATRTSDDRLSTQNSTTMTGEIRVQSH